MKQTILTAAACLLLTPVAFAQTEEPCGFDIWMRHQHQHNPAKAAQLADLHRHVLDNFQSHTRDGVLQIPVVFHVVYNNAAQNLADSVIHSQLEVLNEDYRRLNANAVNTREIFVPVAADSEIEFYLAEVDPNGNPTNGIVRTETDRPGFSLNIFSQNNTLDEVKSSATGGSDAWDTDRYLNIWVCNIQAGLLGQIFGLAYPPDGAPNWPAGSAEPTPEVSGVIVHYTTVGRNNPEANADGVASNNLGRTLTHEVGHYLGLRHIWGDGFFNGCSVDDGIADTPNCASASNQNCNFNANTCTDPVDDLPDMVENYMDYSTDICMNMFTQQQVDVMRFVITELRPGLLQSAMSVQKHESGFVQVFPNPATGRATVRTLNGQPITGVQIHDLAGRIHHNAENHMQTEVELPLNNLSSGVYLVRVSTGDAVSVTRLVVR